MKRILLSLAFLLIPVLVLAQNTSQIGWRYTATTLAEVNGYNQVLSIDGTTSSAPIVCVQSGVDVTCNVNVSMLSSGVNHTLKLDATFNGVSKSTTISGLNPNNAPKDPIGFKYTINVTINF